MSVPVLTFFNTKAGVGKTSLVFHLAWMLSEMGKRVVAIDLDPQAHLTSAFLPEETLEALWDPVSPSIEGGTIFRCLRPLLTTTGGRIQPPQTQTITPRLHLVPGDLALAEFEAPLSVAWATVMDTETASVHLDDRPFSLLTVFWQVAQMAGRQHGADLILADVGPNLGAINRSALIGCDHVVIPLAVDLLSLQGVRSLGPALAGWRTDWSQRTRHCGMQPGFDVPAGAMKPEGYILMQHTERLVRTVNAQKKWGDRIPATYRSSVLGQPNADTGNTSPNASAGASDGGCLARMKHYRSLMPMAQEVRKPIFHLSSADGAIGSHSQAVRDAWSDFKALAVAIEQRICPL